MIFLTLSLNTMFRMVSLFMFAVYKQSALLLSAPYSIICIRSLSLSYSHSDGHLGSPNFLLS